MTSVEIAAQHNVTLEQVDRVDFVHDFAHNRIFALVESQSEPNTYYRVEYNRVFRCLQCRPHNGRPCPASLKGLPCWHKKAAVAAWQIEKAAEQARRKAEQEAMEREESYQFEQMIREFEESKAELEAYLSEVDERERARKAAQSATI